MSSSESDVDIEEVLSCVVREYEGMRGMGNGVDAGAGGREKGGSDKKVKKKMDGVDERTTGNLISL